MSDASTVARDDIEHRLWRCTATRELREAQPELVRVYHQGKEGREKNNGHVAAPNEEQDGLVIYEYRENEEAREAAGYQWDAAKPIYTDGSCYDTRVKQYARAGAAAVQVAEDGRITKGVYAPVPRGWRQTSMWRSMWPCTWLTKGSPKAKRWCK